MGVNGLSVPLPQKNPRRRKQKLGKIISPNCCSILPSGHLDTKGDEFLDMIEWEEKERNLEGEGGEDLQKKHKKQSLLFAVLKTGSVGKSAIPVEFLTLHTAPQSSFLASQDLSYNRHVCLSGKMEGKIVPEHH